MIDSHTLMFKADRAWAAYYCWLIFDRGMVSYLRQTGRSHLCKLIFDGVHVGMGCPMLRAEYDDSLQDEVDLHLAVFNGDRGYSINLVKGMPKLAPLKSTQKSRSTIGAAFAYLHSSLT